jgi:hypothetical protein
MHYIAYAIGKLGYSNVHSLKTPYSYPASLEGNVVIP